MTAIRIATKKTIAVKMTIRKRINVKTIARKMTAKKIVIVKTIARRMTTKKIVIVKTIAKMTAKKMVNLKTVVINKEKVKVKVKVLVRSLEKENVNNFFISKSTRTKKGRSRNLGSPLFIYPPKMELDCIISETRKWTCYSSGGLMDCIRIIIYRFADIIALNKFYFIISKEFELFFVFNPLCHYLNPI